MDYCGANTDLDVQCNGMIDGDNLEKSFSKTCTGKKECEFKPAMFVNYLD